MDNTHALILCDTIESLSVYVRHVVELLDEKKHAKVIASAKTMAASNIEIAEAARRLIHLNQLQEKLTETAS